MKKMTWDEFEAMTLPPMTQITDTLTGPIWTFSDGTTTLNVKCSEEGVEVETTEATPPPTVAGLPLKQRG